MEAVVIKTPLAVVLAVMMIDVTFFQTFIFLGVVCNVQMREHYKRDPNPNTSTIVVVSSECKVLAIGCCCAVRTRGDSKIS